MSAVQAWGVFAGVTLGFGLWTLASLAPAMSRPRLARRIAPYLLDISEGARALVAPSAPGPLPVVGVVFEPIVARARTVLGNLLGGAEQVTRRLRQAGSSMTVEAFRSQQLAWAVGGAVLGIAASIGLPQLPLVLHSIVVVLGAALGVVARDQVLQRAARRRMARLASELPVVLEFLTLSLSAGEGVLDAMRRVGKVSSGDLAVELQSVVSSVSTGLPLGETLAALSKDLDLPAFARCVDQIVGALERGTPLAEVLRAQAQDSRDDSKRELLEVAGRKEIAMMIPLVFLILPVTILFAVFPGIFVLQVGL